MSDSRGRYRTILLFGMPGSGKGTQGAILGQVPSCVHVSMGEVFRKLPAESSMGREITKIIGEGKMVPDDLTIKVYSKYIKNLEDNELLTRDRHILLLDGIPRNTNQASLLDEKLDVLQIFHLKINDLSVAKKRLRTRAMRENRLDDMKDDVIEKRIHIYREETSETLGFYDPAIVYEIEAARHPIKILQKTVNRLCEIESLA